MTSYKETFQDSRRNGLRLPPLPTPFNNDPFHQSHHTTSTDLFFNPKRNSQRNKQMPTVPDSLSPSLKRRTSRFGLSGLFGRSKPLVMEEVQEQLEVHPECEEATETPRSADTARLQKANARPLSPEVQALSIIDPSTATLRTRPSKTALGSKASPKVEVNGGSLTAWDPPPISQVYSQAVRHATLKAPTLSVETILRLNAERGSSSTLRTESYTPEFNTVKSVKEKRLKKPTALDALSKGDWTEKVFVLVTSGYLLQYAGQGSFNRLPEKIMPLSKESVAFASDAIPGKPYVLQISQVSNENGTLDREALRSMFKSMGLRSQMKRSAFSFLLVFDSSEELSSWMAVVRKEIRAMGGKEHRPDHIRKPAEFGSNHELHRRPTRRHLVRKDPDAFPQIPASSSNVLLDDNAISPESSMQTVDSVDTALAKRQSMATQQSVDSRTTSNTAESINQVHLDRLKESPRQSYASTAGKTTTTSTSRDSSPGPSPVNLHADVPQWAPSLNERRQTTSMYHGVVRSSVQQLTLPSKIRPESTASPTAPPSSQSVPKHTSQQQQTLSPAAPNFSVPTFSKRYSSSNSSPTLSCTTSKPQSQPIALTQASPSPSVINEEEESIGKGASIIGEIQHLEKPSPRPLNSLSPSANTLPRSAGSCGPPSLPKGDRPFSRRFSSLEYSRGISPIQLASHSPSPHPPPTTALPPLPGIEGSRANPTTPRLPTSLLPSPPAKSPPRVLVARSPSPPRTELSQRDFPYPPPIKPLPAVPNISPSSCARVLPSSTEKSAEQLTVNEPPGALVTVQATTSSPIAPKAEVPPQPALTRSPTTQESTKPDSFRSRGQRRPVSMQVRSQTSVHHASPPPTAFQTAFDLKNIAAPPTESLPAPPKPTRNPPPPPSEQIPKLITNNDSGLIGRESTPASALPSPRSRISVVSPAMSTFEGSAPHPFIPPIKVSERKFRGSLDGPWNPAYGAPQRNFFDLGAF